MTTLPTLQFDVPVAGTIGTPPNRYLIEIDESMLLFMEVVGRSERHHVYPLICEGEASVSTCLGSNLGEDPDLMIRFRDAAAFNKMKALDAKTGCFANGWLVHVLPGLHTVMVDHSSRAQFEEARPDPFTLTVRRFDPAVEDAIESSSTSKGKAQDPLRSPRSAMEAAYDVPSFLSSLTRRGAVAFAASPAEYKRAFSFEYEAACLLPDPYKPGAMLEIPEATFHGFTKAFGNLPQVSLRRNALGDLLDATPVLDDSSFKVIQVSTADTLVPALVDEDARALRALFDRGDPVYVAVLDAVSEPRWF